MPHTPKRRSTVALTTAVLVAAASAAAAQTTGTTVTTSLGESSRQLTLTDLGGDVLTDLGLVPGAPAPFRVNVTDRGILPTDGFAVDLTLNNLYLQQDGTTDFANMIPSGEVTVDFAPNPLDADGVTALLNPDLLLRTVGTLDCDVVATALGSTVAALGVSTDPLCGATGPLFGTGVDIDSLPVDGSAIPDIGLDSLPIDALPIALDPSALLGGPFSEPDCANGIGSGDPSCGTGAAATTRRVLVGVGLPDVALPPALQALLEGAIPTGEVVGAVTTLEAVLAGMASSGDARLADVASELSRYTPVQATTIVNDAFEAIPALDVADLAGIAGTYTSVTRLTVNPTTLLSGSYAGSLTATLVED